MTNHSSPIEKVLLPIELSRELLFIRILISVWLSIICYAVYFYFLNVKFAYGALLIGAVILCPLTWWLELKTFKTSARLLFIASCNFYIYASGLAFAHRISAEYYYLPATMLPFLLFDRSRKIEIWASVSVTLLIWGLSVFIEHAFFPQEWLANNAPETIIRNVNFLGSFTLTLVFLSTFIKTILQLRDLLVSQAKLESSELKKSEERLKRTILLLEESQTMAKLGGWELNVMTGELYWTDETYRLHDTSPEEFNPNVDAVLKYFLPESKAILSTALEAAMTKGEGFDLFLETKTTKGRKIDVRTTCSVTMENGKYTKLNGIFQDVTEIKKAEFILLKSLKEISDYKHAMNESSIVAFTDTRGIITSVNDSFCSISKYHRDELIGQDHRIINSGYHSKEFFRDLWEKISKGKVWKGELRNKAKDGTIYWVDTTIVPFLDRLGTPYQYLAIRSDITERKDAEMSLQLERAKAIQHSKLASLGEMSAGIAHEINNPLAIISGNLELLTEFKDNPEKFTAKLNSIEKATQRITKIVNGLKKFSRSSEGDTVLISQSLKDICEEVLVLTEGKAKRHSVLLSLSADENLSIFCDVVEIEQVVINLVNNGIDAIKNQTEKWVKLNLFAESGQVVLQVMDSGPGISQSLELKMFEPFFTTKVVGEGTGPL